MLMKECMGIGTPENSQTHTIEGLCCVAPFRCKECSIIIILFLSCWTFNTKFFFFFHQHRGYQDITIEQDFRLNLRLMVNGWRSLPSDIRSSIETQHLCKILGSLFLLLIWWYQGGGQYTRERRRRNQACWCPREYNDGRQKRWWEWQRCCWHTLKRNLRRFIHGHSCVGPW